MPDYTPTFADLCSAIADGGVIATLDGSMYEVNAFELRRYFNKLRTQYPGEDIQSGTVAYGLPAKLSRLLPDAQSDPASFYTLPDKQDRPTFHG
jgi:hypothetical protein